MKTTLFTIRTVGGLILLTALAQLAVHSRLLRLRRFSAVHRWTYELQSVSWLTHGSSASLNRSAVYDGDDGSV